MQIYVEMGVQGENGQTKATFCKTAGFNNSYKSDKSDRGLVPRGEVRESKSE